MNLQEAAAELGVHYQTAYRWVRDGTLAAVKVDSSYSISPAEVARMLARRSAPTPPPQRSTVRSWTNHVNRLLTALLDGEEVECRTIVERLATNGIPVVEICEQLLAPAMTAVGQGWHDGTVSIAAEHRATAITERILARIATHPRGRPRGVCVVSGAPGDTHALPGAMAAVALRDDHWQVHHLGVDLPESEIIAMATDVGASLVVLSLGSYTHRRAVANLTTELENAGIAVLIGEPGSTLGSLVELARQSRSS